MPNEWARLARHVAKIVRRRHPAHVLPEEVNGSFAEMGAVAVDLGKIARDVVLSDDPDRAAQIRHDDDAMDALHSHLFTVLMDREWKHGVTSAVDVTLFGRFYERFADHAVEIGNRVVFQVTGEQCHRRLIRRRVGGVPFLRLNDASHGERPLSLRSKSPREGTIVRSPSAVVQVERRSVSARWDGIGGQTRSQCSARSLVAFAPGCVRAAGRIIAGTATTASTATHCDQSAELAAFRTGCC
jgi:hypothetical protein